MSKTQQWLSVSSYFVQAKTGVGSRLEFRGHSLEVHRSFNDVKVAGRQLLRHRGGKDELIVPSVDREDGRSKNYHAGLTVEVAGGALLMER